MGLRNASALATCDSGGVSSMDYNRNQIVGKRDSAVRQCASVTDSSVVVASRRQDINSNNYDGSPQMSSSGSEMMVREDEVICAPLGKTQF